MKECHHSGAESAQTTSSAQYQRFRLTVRHFEMLSALMHWRSITDAANALSLTQPAVTKLLSSLEKELGITLFDRQPRGCRPTPEVEILMPLVQRVLDDMGSVQRAAWDLREGQRGSITLVANPALSSAFLPTIIGMFRAQYPDVKVSLRVQPARLISDMVSTHQVDLGIVLFPELNTGIEVEPLPPGSFVCALPPTHRLASKTFINVRDLANENIISYQSIMNFGRMVSQVFLDNGVDYSPVCEAEASAAIIGMVQAGMGIGIVDSFTAPINNELEIRPLIPLTHIHIGLMRPMNWPVSRLSERFIESLRQTLQSEALEGQLLVSSPIFPNLQPRKQHFNDERHK